MFCHFMVAWLSLNGFAVTTDIEELIVHKLIKNKTGSKWQKPIMDRFCKIHLCGLGYESYRAGLFLTGFGH